MNKVISKLLSHKKKRLWLILIVLLIIVIFPSGKVINEDFRVYDYSNSKQEDRTIHFNINITKHNKIPFISKNYNILFEVDGRKYKYYINSNPDRKAKYIPLSSTVFKFGVLLPNKDFSEFIILYDENHHFDISNEIKFIVYPQRNELDSLNLLTELLEYNDYNIEQQPMF